MKFFKFFCCVSVPKETRDIGVNTNHKQKTPPNNISLSIIKSLTSQDYRDIDNFIESINKEDSITDYSSQYLEKVVDDILYDISFSDEN